MGRHAERIDWVEVVKLGGEGVSGVATAAKIGISRQKLVLRCQADNGCTVSQLVEGGYDSIRMSAPKGHLSAPRISLLGADGEPGWTAIQDAVSSGAPDEEILSALGWGEKRLDQACEDEHGRSWASWASAQRALLAISFRQTQRDAAYQGSVSMLTLLGREVLGQGDVRGDDSRIDAIRIITANDAEELAEIIKYNRSKRREQ